MGHRADVNQFPIAAPATEGLTTTYAYDLPDRRNEHCASRAAVPGSFL